MISAAEVTMIPTFHGFFIIEGTVTHPAETPWLSPLQLHKENTDL